MNERRISPNVERLNVEGLNVENHNDTLTMKTAQDATRQGVLGA